MDPGKKNLTRFGSDNFFAAWDNHPWVWKISPKNPKKIPFGPKKSYLVWPKYQNIPTSALYLLWVRSMLGMGPVKAHI